MTVTTITVLDNAGTPRLVSTNDAVMALIGEVQASPTSNTLLDRLKTLATALTGNVTTALGKLEDAAHVSGDAGIMALTVRSDAGAALAGTDGDYQPPITDASGRLWVNIGAAASSIAKLEDAAHSSGDTGVAIWAKRTDTAAVSSGTDGDYSTVNVDALGRVWVNPGLVTEDAAAASDPLGLPTMAVRRDTLSSSEVSGDGDIVAVKADSRGALHVAVAATALSIAKAEDVASAGGDVGVPAMAIQLVAPIDTAGTDADYSMLQMSGGRLWAATLIDAVIAASSTITRPADTTAYASGDLVANSVTAGSVAALSFTTAARAAAAGGEVTGCTIQKSTNTTTNAAFRLHLFSVVPTFTSAGDNSAISSVVVASAKGYLGYVDVSAMVGFSDVAWGSGSVDNSRGVIGFAAVATTIYGIVEARGAYAPGNAEVFTVRLHVRQN